MALKYEYLAQHLRLEIRRLRALGVPQLPTEADLCQQYGVSRQTVRHALSMLEKESLIEKRQGCGTFIRKYRNFSSQKIAVITTYIDDYIFPELLREIETTLTAKGFSVQVYSTGNSTFRERQILQTLLDAQSVTGIIVEGVKTAFPNPNLDLYLQIQELQMPLVFLHSAYPDLPQAICIGDDNYNGGYYLTHYLLDQGHRSIGGVFKSDDLQGHQRYSGCVAALRDRSCMQPDDHFLWFTTEDRPKLFDFHHPESLAYYLRDIPRSCTAILCYNDEIAYHLIRLLSQQARRVPEEIAVVSFDNSHYATMSHIPITSLGHTAYTVGRRAAEALLTMLDGEMPISEQLPWKLFQRQSG